MKRRMIYLLVAAAFLFPSACGKKEAPVVKPVFNFKVQTVIGEVKITAAAGERGASAGDAVGLNDIIVTGKKSIADITYGSSGIIRINENSHVSIAAITDGISGDTLINLERGKVFLTLGKLENTGFKVKTPTVVASVRGTSFTVSADLIKGAKCSVMKGVVTVTPVKKGEAVEGKSIDVVAGQKTGYVTEKTVEQVLEGKKEIPVEVMTEEEVKEIKEEALDMNIGEIKGLHEEIKTEVRRDVIDVDPAILRKQASDASGGQLTKSPVKVQSDDRLKRNLEAEKIAAEKKRLEEEELRRQEEMRRIEEERIRAEQVKKERASNIPTL